MESSGRVEQSIDDLFERGFRLAYFLVPERSLALQVITDAVNRLNARCQKEKKRIYWRDKYLKRGGSKISRTDADTLQWLVYFVAERYERWQEECGSFTVENLIIRYIKTLVQTTTGMSSFYVGVGLHRLLHNYTTAEVQRMYELITDRYLGTDEYRRTKRLLMSSLSARFGRFLRTVTVARGETRFDLAEDQGCWASLVSESLLTFVPWSTWSHCLVPADSNAGSVIPGLLSGKEVTVSADTVEINRCHAFIHPDCFSRLVRILGFELPHDRLAVPKFHSDATDHGDGARQTRPTSPHLTSSERATIQAGLDAESARRRRAQVNMLRIVVDSVEYVRFNPAPGLEVRLTLSHGAKLIEFWTQDAKGELLLGTHLLTYSDSGMILPSSARIDLDNLSVNLSDFSSDTLEAERSISLWVKCHESSRLLPKSWLPILRGAPRYAVLMLLLVATGWILRSALYERAPGSESADTIAGRDTSAATTSSTSKQTSFDARSSTTIATLELVPYAETRGAASSDIPTVAISPQTAVVNLEIPISISAQRDYSATLRKFPQRTVGMSAKLSFKDGSKPLAVFPVPVSFLQNDTAYVVEVSAANKSGRAEPMGTFMFRVAQQK